MFEIGGLTLLVLMIGVIVERITPKLAIIIMGGILIIEIAKWYIPESNIIPPLK